jgi:DNA-binding CsgD family transcriptional regulator
MEDAGVVSSLRGTRQATVALLERALTTYEGIAADRDAERVRSRLRATRGGRRERAATRPVAGWNSLTDTEHRVTALVTEGMTNREVATSMFLSRHTIDFHLRQVFRKLGVRSRVQLARLALEQGAPQPADVGLG